MNDEEKQTIQKLLDLLSEGWNNGCGCCSDEYIDLDHPLVQEIANLLKKEQE